MRTVPLYRFTRPEGGITDSTIKPDVDFVERSRLIADEGYILTNGEIFTPCIDTDEPEKWSEVEYTPESNEEVTEADYQNALIEFGVEL